MRTQYACVYCVPGCPRYPHPLTRLCVWRLLPARLLVDPGLPGSTGIPGTPTPAFAAAALFARSAEEWADEVLTPRRSSCFSTLRGRKTSVGPALRGGG